MKTARIFCLFLAIFLVVPPLPTGLAATNENEAETEQAFIDVPTSHWAYAQIQEMTDYGIVQGTGDGYFAPSTSVLVAQFSAMLCRMLFSDELAAYQGDTDAWWQSYADVLMDAGVYNGTAVKSCYKNGNWEQETMEASLSRYDMAQMIYNALTSLGQVMPDNAEIQTVSLQIGDYSSIPKNYMQAVASMYSLGCLSGTDQAGTFNGTSSLDRAQVCVILSRLLLVIHEDVSADSAGSNSTESQMDFSSEYMAGKYYAALQDIKLTGDYRTDIIAVAKSQIGYHEGDTEEEIDGSSQGSGNYSEYGRFLGSNGRAWCSEFASWCARNAGVPADILANSRVANIKNFAAPYYTWDETIYAGGNYIPQAGDLALFAWTGSSPTANNLSHTAIVCSSVQKGSTVILTVIHGNSNNMVREGNYYIKLDGTCNKGQLVYFVAPNYSNA